MITFQNKGILPMIAITTMGINAKSDDSAIGYFGTGLKYALAVILREGGAVMIESGTEAYTFGVQDAEHRGKRFSVVTLNGQPLGFTTELGKNWEPWMAYRELYCNALDEGGRVYGADEKVVHDPDSTTVYVRSEAIDTVHHNRHSIVLEGGPLSHHGLLDVHSAQETSFCYYKGVRIWEDSERYLHTYNIHANIDITEDRTAKYSYQIRDAIGMSVLNSDDPAFIRKVILAPQGYDERHINFEGYPHRGSAIFLDVAEKERLNMKLNPSVMRVLAQHNRIAAPAKATLTPVQQKQLNRAISFCEDLGYGVQAYPIVVSKDLNRGLLGLAENQTIYLSPDIFEHGTKYVAHGLIEEYIHLTTGYGDETRELQSYLFKQLISMGERLLGEPL